MVVNTSSWAIATYEVTYTRNQLNSQGLALCGAELTTTLWLVMALAREQLPT
jgi:hypothetical protein